MVDLQQETMQGSVITLISILNEFVAPGKHNLSDTVEGFPDFASTLSI